jgi:hypothetical protein
LQGAEVVRALEGRRVGRVLVARSGTRLVEPRRLVPLHPRFEPFTAVAIESLTHVSVVVEG